MPNPNTPQFPTAIPSDATLGGVATDNLYTTLSASINNSQTTNIGVTNASFEVPVLLLIDSELILVTSKVGTTLGGATRGFGGSIAASHNAGSSVYGYVFAYQHNQVCAEIQAVCTALGVNLANVLLPGDAAGGDLTGTYPDPELAASGVAAGTYGDDETAVTITVDEKGRITEITEVPIAASGGGAPSGAAGGDLSGTYPDPDVATVGGKTAAAIAQSVDDTIAATEGNSASTIVKRDANGDFAGRNISATTFIGDHQGPVTGNVTGNVSGTAASITGNLAGDVTSVGMNTTLSTTGVAAGTYGSATKAAIVTVDTKGRLTDASETTISGVVPGGVAAGDLGGNYPDPTVEKASNGNFLIGSVRVKDSSGDMEMRNSDDSDYVNLRVKHIEADSYGIGLPNTPSCVKYTVDYTDLIAAATTANYLVIALPAKAKIMGVTVKTSTAFSGSGFTSLVVRVGSSGVADDYTGPYDCLAAVSDTNFYDALHYKSPTMAADEIRVYFTANQNLGNGSATSLAAGSLDIWVTKIQLPD